MCDLRLCASHLKGSWYSCCYWIVKIGKSHIRSNTNTGNFLVIAASWALEIRQITLLQAGALGVWDAFCVGTQNWNTSRLEHEFPSPHHTLLRSWIKFWDSHPVHLFCEMSLSPLITHSQLRWTTLGMLSNLQYQFLYLPELFMCCTTTCSWK